MGKKSKKPHSAGQFPGFVKVPRGVQQAQHIATKNFCWRFSDHDMGGPWGWEHASVQTLLGEIIPKLHEYESMTWAAMEGHSGSHSIDVDGLAKDAQGRLAEIGKDDLDSLFSVRITGERRLWGVKDVAILRVLWWDPHHQVW